MTITNEQRNVLTMIMNNKEVLEELMKMASTQQKQVKDLQIGETITVAGITWSKFAEDSEGNAYMLADESIYDMAFGDNNDWRKSPIRKKLNEKLYDKLVDELGTDVVWPIETDLFSHDGLRDYGTCEDNISLLTYDLYRNNQKNIKSINNWYWTCTPNSTPSGYDSSCAQYVGSIGNVFCCVCDYCLGVRPFFILKSDIFVSCDNVLDGR